MTVVEGRRHEGHFDLSCDVVIVGSGAGGAVVAKELAEAGLEVIVLEEGPYVPHAVYAGYRPTETLRHLGREAGTTAVLGLGDTPVITVMAGRAVGGSSIMTGGVCFRIPHVIHEKWIRERGLADLDERAFEAAFAHVERESHVETVPDAARSIATSRFVQGAARLGIPMKAMRRNTLDCKGHARCNFGCPSGAKLSVDLTFLPKAQAAGARIYSDCLVEEVIVERGRAAGVRGRILGERVGTKQERRGKLLVRAKVVVVAAGTLHTPLLLMRSGLRSPALGRHVTLHPGFRVVARFDERVDGWRGALQSVYSDHYEDQGVTFTGLFVPPGAMAATLPGTGKAFAQRIASLPNLGLIGGIVHDEDGGRIRPGFGREPLITYRLAKKDKAAMLGGTRALAEVALAAGAREVYLPIFGAPPITSKQEIAERLHDGIPARRMECVTFHPLGSARIARDATQGVVDVEGRAFELEGLVVADGSVFPTSIGVNSQLPIMAMAAKIAWRLRDRMKDRAVGPGAVRAAAVAP